MKTQDPAKLCFMLTKDEPRTVNNEGKPTQNQHKAREQPEVHVYGCLFCANKCTMSSDSDSDSSMTIGVPSVPSAAAKADATVDGSEASSAKIGTKIGTTGTNDPACASAIMNANTADDNTINRGKRQDTNKNTSKSERARQRWVILRAALLGNIDDSDGNGTSANANTCSANDASTQVNRASIHRFEGFQLLDRKLLSTEDAEKCALIAQQDLLGSGKNDTIRAQDQDEQVDDHEYEYAEYATPVPSNTPIRIRTRERRRHHRETQKGQEANSNIDDTNTKTKRIDQVMRGLLSHRLHGVDNTGQSCV